MPWNRPDALDQVEKSSISEEEHELAILEMHFHADSPHYILLHGNDEFHWYILKNPIVPCWQPYLAGFEAAFSHGRLLNLRLPDASSGRPKTMAAPLQGSSPRAASLAAM